MLARDGGGSLSIGAENGNIRTLYSVSDRVFILAERAIITAKLADQIDPERSNPYLPLAAQQVEINYGVSSEFIQRSICIAAEVFQPEYSPHHVNSEVAFLLSVRVAQLLGAVADTIEGLRSDEAATRSRLAERGLRYGDVPSTRSLQHRVHAAFADLRAVRGEVFALSDMFYPRAKGTRFDKELLSKLTDTLRYDDVALQVIPDALSVLSRVADYRDAMIHQDSTKSMTVRDYELGADGNFIAPTVEVVHPLNPIPRQDVVHVLERLLDLVSGAFEAFVVILGDRNVRQRLGIKSWLVEADNTRAGGRFAWTGTMTQASAPTPSGE